ncbi:MAG: precorrin-3B C(17)-methyltransferase [Verrucomicrobia bacterium]|nr:precorrin-3B C(17)-methyltransferase [Verrucomicrobiota bacterium]
MSGKLNLVSVGPGATDLIPPLAQSALCAGEVIVGYELYLTWIKPWIDGKAVYAFPLTQERERALFAIQHARNGHSVCLVSSGDVGVYGMAAVVLEQMAEDDTFELNVIPGISAATSCASLLGSPLSHDFATLSLSDLLCPWDQIEHRARQLAQADLVVALYNVQSKTRQEGVYRILRLFLEEKGAATWCGVVRNAYRPGQEAYICTLAELLERRFDMLTTMIVGNQFTRRKGNFIFTPRVYVTRASRPCNDPDARGRPSHELTAPGDPSHQPVWVFSGTSDGNALASKLSATGYHVIVSTATEYGREIVCENLPGITIRSGRMGADARRRELVNSGARAIVDATHPFAITISHQLMQLAKMTSIPYLRYERPPARSSSPAVFCKTMREAAAESVAKGGRVFLASGAKDLPIFLKHEGASRCEWYVRLTPEPDSLRRALDLGVPRANICAMQGPFSKEFDELLWKSWRIDCVVTKESGEVGGFLAKAEAARSLGIRLIVVERPQVDYPIVAYDFDSVVDQLKRLLSSGSFSSSSLGSDGASPYR